MYIRCWILKVWHKLYEFYLPSCLVTTIGPPLKLLDIYPPFFSGKVCFNLLKIIIFGGKKTELLQKVEKGAIYSYIDYTITCHNYNVYSWLYTYLVVRIQYHEIVCMHAWVVHTTKLVAIHVWSLELCDVQTWMTWNNLVEIALSFKGNYIIYAVNNKCGSSKWVSHFAKQSE